MLDGNDVGTEDGASEGCFVGRYGGMTHPTLFGLAHIIVIDPEQQEADPSSPASLPPQPDPPHVPQLNAQHFVPDGMPYAQY